MEPGKEFDFSLHARNQKLSEKLGDFTFLKTGTTICAAIFDGGVVLGADTRATAGPIVAVKDEMKIHYIADKIWCCGAGTAADNDKITDLISSKIRLYQMNTNNEPRVDQCATLFANRLFKYGGYIQAALIVGGVDFQGPSVFTIYPHGSVTKSPFTSMGSGSLAAISVLENGWKPKMTEADCKELVADAIFAGITNDLGSGSNVNLCVIKQEGSQFFKNYRITNQRNFQANLSTKSLPVEVIRETVRPLSLPEVHLEILDGAA